MPGWEAWQVEVGRFGFASEQISAGFARRLLLGEDIGCFFGGLHAYPTISIKSRGTTSADVANVRRPTVDALNSREAGPAGTCC